MSTFLEIKNFADSERLFELENFFHDAQNTEGYKKFENIAELNSKNIEEHDLIANLKNDIQKMCESFHGVELEFHKLWCVESSPENCNENELPYIPHFDKVRYIKGFVYLNNVRLNCGPLNVATREFENVERLRRKLPKDYYKKKLNVIGASSGLNFKPLTGDAGSLFVFDTNTPHKAGIVEPGQIRKVLRFDFHQKGWNSHFGIFNKFVNTFKRG